MVDDYGIGQRDSLQVSGPARVHQHRQSSWRGRGRELLQACWLAGWRCRETRCGGSAQLLGGGTRSLSSSAAAWVRVQPLARPAGPHPACPLPVPQDAVEAVGRILGMQACEGTDAVPPNARSHTLLLSGTVVGDVQVLVRLAFGIDSQRNVAMKLAVRSESPEVSEAIHAIIQEA